MFPDDFSSFPCIRSSCEQNIQAGFSTNYARFMQLNSILPLVISIQSLSLIKSPTRVLLKFGTYQSRPIVPFLLINSLITSLSVMYRSTVGFMAGFCASGFDVPCPAAAGFALCTYSVLSANCLIAPSSMHCASTMALVWPPVPFSIVMSLLIQLTYTDTEFSVAIFTLILPPLLFELILIC